MCLAVMPMKTTFVQMIDLIKHLCRAKSHHSLIFQTNQISLKTASNNPRFDPSNIQKILKTGVRNWNIL